MICHEISAKYPHLSQYSIIMTFLFMHEITPDFFQTVPDMLDYKPVKENPGYLV